MKKINIPTLLAAHLAGRRGPPVGRGPQVENRCANGISTLCHI